MNLISNDRLQPLELGVTQYNKILNVKIHCYVDSMNITDIENASKRGGKCKQFVLIHDKTTYEAPINLLIYDVLEKNNLLFESLDHLIIELLKGNPFFEKVLRLQGFYLYSRLVNSYQEYTPFGDLPKRVIKWFDSFKIDYDNLQDIADQAAHGVKDTGTCNFDNVFIRFPFNNSTVQRSSIIYNISLLEYKRHPLYGNGYLLNLQFNGQGLKRTVAAQALYEWLHSKGYDVNQWHEID